MGASAPSGTDVQRAFAQSVLRGPAWGIGFCRPRAEAAGWAITAPDAGAMAAERVLAAHPPELLLVLIHLLVEKHVHLQNCVKGVKCRKEPIDGLQ